MCIPACMNSEITSGKVPNVNLYVKLGVYPQDKLTVSVPRYTGKTKGMLHTGGGER